jgi:hypothetical protein
MERDALMDINKEEDENVLGMVLVTAYKDNTYRLESSFDLEETHELLSETILDIEEGSLEGLEGYQPITAKDLH